MASLNQVSIIGYVGDEPKIIPMQTGRKMASIRIATTERGYIRQDGTQVADKTDWHSVVLFGKVAEVVEKYLHKGSQVFVQGRLSSRQYEKDGVKHTVVEIIADTMQLLDRKPTTQQSVTQDPYQSPMQSSYGGYSPNPDSYIPF